MQSKYGLPTPPEIGEIAFEKHFLKKSVTIPGVFSISRLDSCMLLIWFSTAMCLGINSLFCAIFGGVVLVS